MRRLGILSIVLALAACDSDTKTPTGPQTSGPIVFTAQLSAANETPAISGPEALAGGTATITFDVPRDAAGNPTGPGTATFAMQLKSFPPGTPGVAAHIHVGASGVPGPIVVGTTLSATAPILASDGTVNITVPSAPNALTQTLATQITANPAGYYFNVHTPLNPGGAVRGQLVRVQ
jgi:hypothetical protein